MGASRFVVIAARRTGSNLLCTLLDSHPEILCHHEIFNPAGVFYAQSLRGTGFDLGPLAERDANPREFLERVWSRPEGRSRVGFKLTCGQAESTLEQVLADPLVHKIVLYRRNRVKTCVSERVAERLDQWEVYEEKELAPRPRIALDVRDLREHAARNQRFYRALEATLERTHQPFLRVHYEALWDGDERARLLRFLGLETAGVRLEPGSVKQNPADLRQLLSNFDELADALRGDPLREELLDPES